MKTLKSQRLHIGIFGKTNVGKSSLLNRIAGQEISIVSDIAGTTRDAIDTEIIHQGREYIFIDTAGLRRKNKIKEEIDIPKLYKEFDNSILKGLIKNK